MNIKQTYLKNNPCYIANVKQQDSRYTTFQKRGPLALMLHSVGCAQPSAEVFVNRWNMSSYGNACVHAFIDANNGTIYQCLPWNYRGWHGGGSSNNTHVGVEMCESKYIKYTSGTSFTVLDKQKALADCKRAYNAAVELFAKLCKDYKLDPLKDICSHSEGYKKGIATNHGDPEHYWKGVGSGYTMDGFRKEVKAKMEETKKPAANPTTAAAAEKVYNKVSECPEWAREAITAYVDNGYLKGDEKGNLSLDNNLLRMLVVQYRVLHDKGLL